MRKKQLVRQEQKQKGVEAMERQLKIMDDAIEKEKHLESEKKRKFMEFDFKNQRKNQWFEQNIIVPQMERHLKDFETEKQYHEERSYKQIEKEMKEAEIKKQKEIKVFLEVQKQIEEKKLKKL
jgi:hypothetical protein